MRLTRRDVLAGLSTGLASVAVSEASLHWDPGVRSTATGQTASLDATDVETLVALSDVVYPSAVTVEPGFVDGYFATLGTARVEAARRAVTDLDRAARSAYGARFGVIEEHRARALLSRMGVDTAFPRPDGTVPARVRYHLVNGLLFALFTSPAGGALFDIDNPIGHPGGYYGDGGG